MDEIIKRYQYQEGFINLHQNNTEIKKSTKPFLNNTTEYNDT
jgi:hypothetical protein